MYAAEIVRNGAVEPLAVGEKISTSSFCGTNWLPYEIVGSFAGSTVIAVGGPLFGSPNVRVGATLPLLVEPNTSTCCATVALFVSFEVRTIHTL